MRHFIKILFVVFLSLAGLWLLAGIALSAYFYLAAPESPVVDDSDLRIAEVAVPDEENAYAAFLSVTNLLDCSSEDKSVLSAYSMYCDGQSKPFSSWRKDGTPETCRAEVDRILSERTLWPGEWRGDPVRLVRTRADLPRGSPPRSVFTGPCARVRCDHAPTLDHWC